MLDIIIHHDHRSVSKDGEVIPLTMKEYDLLLFLVQNQNIALYCDTLYEKVWKGPVCVDTRTLDLRIQRLRKKLD